MFKKINKKIDDIVSKYFGISFIILSVIIVVIISLLLTYLFSYYAAKLDEPLISPDGYAALFGALGGGAMTLFGVLLTMKEQDKQRRFEKDEREKERLNLIENTKPIYEMHNYTSDVVCGIPTNTLCLKYFDLIPRDYEKTILTITVTDIRHQNISATQIAHIAFYKDITYKYKNGMEKVALKKEYILPQSFKDSEKLNRFRFTILSFNPQDEVGLNSILYFPEILYKDFEGHHFRRKFKIEVKSIYADILAESDTELISEIEFMHEKNIFNKSDSHTI